MTAVLLCKERRRDTQMRRDICEGGGRHLGNRCASRGMATVAGRRMLPYRFRRDPGLADALISDL